MRYIVSLAVFILFALTITLAQGKASWVVDSNVVGIMAIFDEGSGQPFLHDAVLRIINDGEIGGNAEWVSGKIRPALHFDGLTSVCPAPQFAFFKINQ